MIETSAAEKIALFLDRYPGGKLRIAAGYATVWGLAWLHRNTDGRPVDIVVGDCRPRFFSSFTQADAADALAFLARDDVRLMNWYSRRNPRNVHMKLWMLEDRNGNCKVLAGSANLTRRGMLENFENMGEYHGDHREAAARQMRIVFGEAWDAKDRIVGYIAPPPTPPLQPMPVRVERRPARKPRRQRDKSYTWRLW